MAISSGRPLTASLAGRIEAALAQMPEDRRRALDALAAQSRAGAHRIDSAIVTWPAEGEQDKPAQDGGPDAICQ